MPGNHPGPRFCLAAELDATAWSNTAVFRRGGAGSVTLATYSGSTGAAAGRFEDPLAFLNGYGSQASRDLAAEIQAAWTLAGGLGAISVELVGTGSDADKLKISTNLEDFTIPAHADNATWGLDTAGHGLVGGVAPFVRIAPSQWVRGIVENKRLRIQPAGGAATFAPGYDYVAQSVVTLMRTSAMGDADDGVATSLETLDCDAYDNLNRELRWGIDDDGHVYYSRPVGTSATIEWLDTDFRDRLGFSGDETEVVDGTLATLTADDPMPGVIVPTRGLRRGPLPSTRLHADALVTRGGNVHGISVGAEKTWALQFWLGDLIAEVDEHRHFFDHFVEYAPPAYRVAFFGHWGDPRRGVEDRANAAYTLLQTPERNGYRGRLRCKMSPGSVDYAWDHEGESRQRGVVDLTMHRAVD